MYNKIKNNHNININKSQPMQKIFIEPCQFKSNIFNREYYSKSPNFRDKKRSYDNKVDNYSGNQNSNILLNKVDGNNNVIDIDNNHENNSWENPIKNNSYSTNIQYIYENSNLNIENFYFQYSSSST